MVLSMENVNNIVCNLGIPLAIPNQRLVEGQVFETQEAKFDLCRDYGDRGVLEVYSYLFF
jgi:hypothetical protein